MQPTLVVLAAGMGSRYGGLKQLDPVGPRGEIILDYSVRDALKAGFGKTVFVIRREMAELFREQVGRRYEDQTEVCYAFQELDPLPGGRVAPSGRTKPWGTGHAVLAARDVVHEPFAVINADDYYGPAGFTRLSSFLAENPSWHYAMVGYRLDRTLSEHGSVSRGLCHVREGRLLDIKELTAISRDGDGIIRAEGNPPRPLGAGEIVSMNFWGFLPSFFERLEELFQEFLEEKLEDPKAEFYLPGAVASLILSGEVEVQVLETSEPWLGLTYPQDREGVVSELKRLRSEG